MFWIVSSSDEVGTNLSDEVELSSAFFPIEEGELDIMFSGCIRLVESELEFDGFTIRVEDGYYILDGYDGPIFILPKGNTEDEKRHSLYNIFKVLVERIENEE